MSEIENLAWWIVILIFVIGGFGVFLRVRHWWNHRKWNEVMQGGAK